MSNIEFRQKMISALEATGADGASITGTESEVNITLTFKREVESCTKSCSDSRSLTCCGGSVSDGAAGRNMELPQGTDPSPARRMWRRWVKPLKDGDICDALWKDHEKDRGRDPGSRIPVTILPGHSAVEEIEREAYLRGVRECEEKMQERIERIERQAYERGKRDAFAIDGVSPVVVDGWTMPHLIASPWHSVERNLHVYEYDYGEYDPCRVAIWPGIGPDGKLVNS